MKDFSITRIPDNDLIGLLFPPLVSLSEYEIDVIHPEYIKGYSITSSGNVSTNTLRQYAVVDLSDYDYALVPVQADGQGHYYYTGCRNNQSTGSITGSQYCCLYSSIINTCYALFKIASDNYACVNTEKDNDLPVIGFKRHRSDGVNPKSPAYTIEVKEAVEEPVEEPVEKTVKRSTKK